MDIWTLWRCISYWKWGFSMAMLVYQRVVTKSLLPLFMHWNTCDGKFVYWVYYTLVFVRGVGRNTNKRLFWIHMVWVERRAFVVKKCVCVFRKGCEIPCYFNLQFFHAFPVDGKVSMIFQDVSILFENFHFILPPTLNFSKWESLPQCHWQLVVIQLQVLAVRWACSIKYS